MPEKSLIKALTEAGIGPRRRMAEAIKQGKVKVNDTVAESFNHPVDPQKDSVSFDRTSHRPQAGQDYLPDAQQAGGRGLHRQR